MQVHTRLVDLERHRFPLGVHPSTLVDHPAAPRPAIRRQSLPTAGLSTSQRRWSITRLRPASVKDLQPAAGEPEKTPCVQRQVDRFRGVCLQPTHSGSHSTPGLTADMAGTRPTPPESAGPLASTIGVARRSARRATLALW
jgi:hypothetical protein